MTSLMPVSGGARILGGSAASSMYLRPELDTTRSPRLGSFSFSFSLLLYCDHIICEGPADGLVPPGGPKENVSAVKKAFCSFYLFLISSL